jgi:hypothetical protein
MNEIKTLVNDRKYLVNGFLLLWQKEAFKGIEARLLSAVAIGKLAWGL